GANVRQVQAIADGVVEHLRKELGTKPARVEGFNSAEWVLLDYGDFVFHVFEEKARRFYDLERLWRDGARVTLPPEVAGGEGSLRTER
ncbi:MAG: ribosome silencing factor, partial [Rubrivivax sp.]|nr:ribosome silencing factor [Pyrinomonadaceae bacterium]